MVIISTYFYLAGTRITITVVGKESQMPSKSTSNSTCQTLWKFVHERHMKN